MTLGLESPETSPEAARGNSAAFCQFIHAQAAFGACLHFLLKRGVYPKQKR
jgi:hypothetical protein